MRVKSWSGAREVDTGVKNASTRCTNIVHVEISVAAYPGSSPENISYTSPCLSGEEPRYKARFQHLSQHDGRMSLASCSFILIDPTVLVQKVGPGNKMGKIYCNPIGSDYLLYYIVIIIVIVFGINSTPAAKVQKFVVQCTMFCLGSVFTPSDARQRSDYKYTNVAKHTNYAASESGSARAAAMWIN